MPWEGCSWAGAKNASRSSMSPVGIDWPSFFRRRRVDDSMLCPKRYAAVENMLLMPGLRVES